ncbi:MAG: glycosyltransferase [Candidatus Bipolaricaulota bacterium]|nr:glycosyltransferase [Candidatus Bipolaricaulota bacterium]
MEIYTDILTLFFIGYCLLYNGFLFFYVLIKYRERRRDEERPLPANGEWPILTIMIPALNEGKVLRNTVASLFAQRYPGILEVLVIDDGSEDVTPLVTARLQSEYPRFYAYRRERPHAREGKGEALNAGLRLLLEKFPDRLRQTWVIGVFDADGRLVEPDFLEQVGLALSDLSVNALQCGVRIRNRHKLLPALQDVEFVAFSWIVQWVRDRVSGAVALGGNGQFIRADCLELLQSQGPWAKWALTEDLEISVRLHQLPGRIRFLDRHVSQEGVESWRALFKQRRRWAWGTLQVFVRYVASGALWRAPMPLLRKLDLHYYLSFWIVPFVVLASWGLAVLSWLGQVKVGNSFPVFFLLANSFSFWPTMVLALHRIGIALWIIPQLVLLGTLYSYHWIPLLFLAWGDILRKKKPHWLKTQRIYS